MGDMARRDNFDRRIRRIAATLNDPNWEDIVSPVIETRLELLDQYWAEFRAEQETLIEGAMDEEAINAQDQVFDQTENIFIDTKARMRSRIAELRPAPVQVPAVVERVVQPVQHRIKIKPFNGDFAKWREFRDTFISSVHNNANLSPIQKLQELKEAVTGEADRVLGTWQLADANYVSAWARLNEVYDNEQQIVSAHIHTLMTMKPMQELSYNGLRILIDTPMQEMRSLEALNVAVAEWDPLIVYLITARLDAETAREWEMNRVVNRLPTLAELYTFLERRAIGIARAENSCQHEQRSNLNSSTHNTNSSARNSNDGANKSKANNKKADMSCSVCKAGHQTFKCPDLVKLSVQHRIDKIRNAKLCLNCLRSGHQATQCPYGVCRRCNKKHNSLLCLQSRDGVVSNVTVVAQNADPTANYNDEGTD